MDSCGVWGTGQQYSYFYRLFSDKIVSLSFTDVCILPHSFIVSKNKAIIKKNKKSPYVVHAVAKVYLVRRIRAGQITSLAASLCYNIIGLMKLEAN